MQLYQDRANSFSQQAEALQKKYNWGSFLRLFYFLGGLAMLISIGVFLNPVWLFPIGILWILGFGAVIQWHQRLLNQKEHLERLALVNRQEAAIAQYQFEGLDDGMRFLDPAHPNALDLDLFGPHSLFVFISRAVTRMGKDKMANYLSAPPAPLDEIRDRQTAVLELSPPLDWRQDFQAAGAGIADSSNDWKTLQQWIHTPVVLIDKPWMKILFWWAPFGLLAALLLGFYWEQPFLIAVLPLAPHGYFILKLQKQITAINQQTERCGALLERYASLIQKIEGAPFHSPKLVALRQPFFIQNEKASKALRGLGYYVRQLNVRNNIFSIFLQLGGAWDLQYTWKLEQWKRRWGAHLSEWLDSLAEWEALISLANLQYNHPDWALPEVNPETGVLSVDGLGHTLIPADVRVVNQVDIPLKGHLWLLTGSNMAGKSTFLRTIGVNIVLAMAGGPVCARRMQVAPLEVFSSMRTKDDLHERTSSFMAELKRLQFVLESVKRGPGVFFLLDEILKGTNSRDRHSGAQALIHQLINSECAGIVATHDLELTDLEQKYEGKLENWRLEESLLDDQLIFDYKLKKGVSQSFSATQLMRQLGIL